LEVTLRILCFVSIGESLPEIGLKEIPELFIGFQNASIDPSYKNI
jgi:hypothetical protein